MLLQGSHRLHWMATLSKSVVVAVSFDSNDSSIAVAFKAASKRRPHLNRAFLFFLWLKEYSVFRFLVPGPTLIFGIFQILENISNPPAEVLFPPER
jgi:hypothetical protein